MRLIRAGIFAILFTLSSHDCWSTFGMLLVSLTKRAACTISRGYTDAVRIVAMSGSGCRAMGMASFSNSAALSFAEEDGGGEGFAAGAP
jgi:hypothetical protein